MGELMDFRPLEYREYITQPSMPISLFRWACTQGVAVGYGTTRWAAFWQFVPRIVSLIRMWRRAGISWGIIWRQGLSV